MHDAHVHVSVNVVDVSNPSAVAAHVRM